MFQGDRLQKSSRQENSGSNRGKNHSWDIYMCTTRSGAAGERRRRPACTIDWSWHILPPRPPSPFHGKVVHRSRPSLAFCYSSISAIIGFLTPLSPPWTGSLSIAYETNIDLSTCILDSSIDKTERGGKTRGKIKSRHEREERKVSRSKAGTTCWDYFSKSWERNRGVSFINVQNTAAMWKRRSRSSVYEMQVHVQVKRRRT